MAHKKLEAASSSATYQNITSTDDFPYDENILGWLQNIKRAWSSWKKSATISQMLHNCYSNASNPYYCALYLMFNSGDMYYAKPSTLSYTVMEELQKWLNQYGPDNFSSCLADPNLKMKAFNIVTKQRNLSLMRLVFSIFKLADIRDIFLDDIHELLKTNQYKEVSYVVSALGLYDKFNVEDFLVPLVLQDKLSVIEEYLFTCPSQQTELVSYLDRLLGSGNTFCEVERIAMRLEVPEPKYEKFNYKPLSKLISRLSKKYHIPLSFCPNLERKRKEGALHFLLTKKYVENSIGGDSWRELIGDAVGSSENLQKELVISLTQFGDDYEALHWARVYNIPFEDVPFNVKEIWDTEPNSPPDNAYSTTPNTAVSENWDNDTQTKDDCHKFPLPIQHIHLIDNEDRLRWLINEQLNGVNIVGFDAEWKPSFVGTKTSKLALLQIATLTNVYIIDLVALDTKSHWWRKLGQDLFGNENILKLGFGIEGDVTMMKQCLSLGDINFKGKGYIDLAVLWKKLVNDWSMKFPHTQSNYTISPEGLSKLVYLCLGQKLDKDDQFSDWERRPLRETQKVYAALDAYCLLEVYEVLQNCCMKQDIPFYEVCVETMVSMNKKTTKSRSERRHQNNELIPLPPSPNVDPVPVSWLRVVCQNGLEGLGKQLRMCGVDAVLLPHMSSHDDCLKAARLDNRIIVTRGSVYNRLYRNVPPGYCFRVETNSSETQVLEILEYYNVVVKDTDIFSRCMVCNSDNFVKLESKVIRELAIVNQQAKSLPVTPYLKSSMDYVEKAMIDMENRFLSDDEDDYGVEAVPGPAVDKPEVNNLVRMHNCQTQSGAHIKVEDIPIEVIDKTPFFFVCENCGKCYWDGTHLRNTLHGRLEKVIKKSSGSGSSNCYHK